MTADLRSTLDDELDGIAPPSPLSGVAIAALGRRRLRRRRLAGALSGLTAIVAITVAASQILGGAAVPAALDLADLPTKATYWWHYGDPATTDYSTALSDALWRELRTVPDATFTINATNGERTDGEPPIQRYDAQLFDDVDQNLRDTDAERAENRVGPVVPLYRLPEDLVLYVTVPGTDAVTLDARVLPSGSYLRQPPSERSLEGPPEIVDPYVEPYCTDWSSPDADPPFSFTVDHDCTRSTLDTGEMVVGDSARTSTGTTEGLWLDETVVVYTDTGAAVLLRARSSGGEENPALDLDRLTTIAAALAAVPVI